MYLIVYKGKDAQALQKNNSAEIPNTYKIQPFPPSLITATSVPKGAWGQVSGVIQLPDVRFQVSGKQKKLNTGFWLLTPCPLMV